MRARVSALLGAHTYARDTAHEAAHVSMCANARVGVRAFAGSRTCGCACMYILYAYMIYHIDLSKMIVTLGAWGP